MQIFPYKLLVACLFINKTLPTHTPQTTTKFNNQLEESSGVQQKLSIKLVKGRSQKVLFCSEYCRFAENHCYQVVPHGMQV